MSFQLSLASLGLALVGLTADAQAQTRIVRGDVDGIRNTAGLFVLDCTNIRLQSSTVNLQALHDASRQQNINYEMVVNEVGTAQNPVLDVVSATVIAEDFDMGNLRFGRSDSWEVFATPFAQVEVWVDARVSTRYQPLDPFNTWYLGPDAQPILRGTANAFGLFQTQFLMPTVPSLLGLEVTGQAGFVDAQGVTLTALDCKEIRS